MASRLTIAEASRATGLSATTLRYYERVGLLEPVTRDEQGRRVYDASDVGWINFLLLLRATGMPVRLMRRFMEFEREGPHTLPQRVELLEQHEREVRARLETLSGHLAHLQTKVAWYRDEAASTNGTG